MFCSKCRVENRASAQSCQICGSKFSGGSTQFAQAVPSQFTAVAVSNLKTPSRVLSVSNQPIAESKVAEAAIWNPNTTGILSLIFSPVFGSYLQMLNWQALGKPEKAAISKMWFYLSLGVVLSYALATAIMKDSKFLDGLSNYLGMGLLGAWYGCSGSEQGKYVKEKFGSSYPKKPWTKALLCGVAGVFTFLVIATILARVVG